MHNKQIAIIGLGYVGLPLAIEFAKKHSVIGFDTNYDRVQALLIGKDHTNEADIKALNRALASKSLQLSSTVDAIKDSSIFIVTVPTPVNKNKSPNLEPLISASKMIGEILKVGDIVIYESTVYPGCTEEECVPVLENSSGLKFNIDFFCGYSPERINPGDKINTLVKIKKVTSGSTPSIAKEIDSLYGTIISAGTHLAPSIKVAEASKAIENAQRDINISFVNELALIFDKMNIDTSDVLAAAATKWNFLNYKPGLVGGHCISVDPYYLAYKAETLGYKPEVILSGRKVNDNMGNFVAQKVIKLMIQRDMPIKKAKVLILGFAFKENCPDTRNTKVVDIVYHLKSFGADVEVFDPLVNVDQVKNDFKLSLLSCPAKDYSAIILAVAHQEFETFDFRSYRAKGTVIFDIKSFVDRSLVDARL